MFKASSFTKLKIEFSFLDYFLFYKHLFIATTHRINFKFTKDTERVQNETICPKIWKVA